MALLFLFFDYIDTGTRPSEAHVLNVPRVGNLTLPLSWKVEDQGMSDKRSEILENTP